MHSINYDDLDKVSSHVYKNISAISKPTLTSTKEAILKSLGYKNLHAFQQSNQTYDKDAGLLKHFTPQEIISIAGLKLDFTKKSYSNFDLFISDVLSKLNSSDEIMNIIYTNKINFLKFLNNNNFVFFDYRWFKQSIPLNNKGQKIPESGFISSRKHLELWNSIKTNNTLASISLYGSSAYEDYFIEKLAVENKKIYTVYDFIKSTFISIKKHSFFKIALDIINSHYILLSNLSTSMNNIKVTDCDYQELQESETYEHHFIFKEEHLNKIAKKINKKGVSLEQVKDCFTNLFSSAKKMNIVAPDYDFNREIIDDYFMFKGDVWGPTRSQGKEVFIANLKNNIILANENVFRYNHTYGVEYNDISFKKRIKGEYYKYFVSELIISKEHFHNSWLSYDFVLYIYLHFHIMTNKTMRMNDFIYFCKNFITDPDIMNVHINLISDILFNKYSLFLSNHLFQDE